MSAICIGSPRAFLRELLLRLGVAPLVAIVALAACTDVETPVPLPPQVDVARPLSLDVVEWDEYTGRLSATDRVEVRARVGGYLESIHYEEGEMVDEGDLLFVVDPRPFEAALSAVKAERDQAAARLELARSDRQRAGRLIKSRAISEEEFDRRVTSLRDAEAAVRAAEAAVRDAELDLEFAQVRAPIAGRAGRHLVTEGNLINGGTAQSTLLTTIVSLDPIHCYFEADERAYLKYVRLDREGQRPGSRTTPNPVFLALADEEGFLHRGYMDFVDNELDVSTGTILGRAVFPNSEALLSPGLFARILLLGSGRYEALLIPDSAIAMDQSEHFVYVVLESGQVERRSVRTGAYLRGLRAITEGLTAGDYIVVSGLQQVRAGSEVRSRVVPVEAGPALIPLDELFPNGAAPAPGEAPTL